MTFLKWFQNDNIIICYVILLKKLLYSIIRPCIVFDLIIGILKYNLKSALKNPLRYKNNFELQLLVAYLKKKSTLIKNLKILGSASILLILPT